MNRGRSGPIPNILGGALLALLVLPVLALALRVDAADFAQAADAGLADAIGLSIATTSAAAAVLVGLGTPLAWVLARRPSRALETLVRLPAVTPPAVAGVALLSAFGRRGVFAPALAATGLDIAFTPAAVVLAQVFVASPFYVLPMIAAFRELDEELLWAARSLGASRLRTFFTIALPLTRPAALSALAVAWARALGEFGATLVFAGNLPGSTQTLPIAIYAAMEGDLAVSRALSLVLLALAIVIFAALQLGARSTR